MSIVLITGNHPRHLFLVQELAKTGLVSGWVQEVRENFLPKPPPTLSDELTALFQHHFSQREAAEAAFFNQLECPDIPTLTVAVSELNSLKTQLFLQGLAPKLVLSYGCHKISADLMREVAATFWNTHGGLSPDYRGVTTHFWPSYLLEPQMTGMTLHETTQQLDGGGIIHQSSARMVRGDGLHELAARTVSDYVYELAQLLPKLDFTALPKGITQQGSGRLFRVSDWRPEHLRLIYQVYQDRMVDAVLDGALTGRKPVLQSVLKQE